MTSGPERVLPALAAVLALLALASCASLDRRHGEGGSFELSYGYYTLDPRSMRMVPVEFAMPPGGLVLVFPTVPGAIMGAPRGAPLRTIPVEPGATFELRLPGTMSRHAARFDSDSLAIEPADTRVARLGTFHEFPEYGVFRGGGGFIDTRSGSPMLLAYFSNPARLSGRVRDPTGTYRYDVNVEQAGWSWLAVREQAGGSFRVEEYRGPVGAIEFGVLLPPAMLGGT